MVSLANFVQRAEAGGYRALCLTVDTPITGARNRETGANVKLQSLPNMKGLKGFGNESTVQTGSLDIFSSVPGCRPQLEGRGVAAFFCKGSPCW